eukprot:scaffold175172_cov18-Tisochrysis_lutea.AAC.1
MRGPNSRATSPPAGGESSAATKGSRPSLAPTALEWPYTTPSNRRSTWSAWRKKGSGHRAVPAYKLLSTCDVGGKWGAGHDEQLLTGR